MKNSTNTIQWQFLDLPKINRPGHKIAVRVISQFGEESTKVLTVK